MKYTVILFALLLGLCGCKREQINKSNSILLLKVDYQTFAFEGGEEQSISTSLPNVDTIPLRVYYKSPGDFGEIALYYKPDDMLLFKGSIIWMGKGSITHPVTFRSPGTFATNAVTIDYPGDAAFKLKTTPTTEMQNNLKQIWKTIAKLNIVSDYRKSGKKIEVLLYTPSVGIGNPADWDWIILMGK